MINPSGIPQFTGDFEQLDKDVSGLRSDAIGIRNGGMDVHSRFQMLGAYYTAPEADDLFATTQPVMDKADTFATDLETVADALDTFSIEARPLAKRLEQLKTDALAFVGSVDGDDDWTEDEDKVHRNKELVDDVTATQLAFQEAERRAASKISTIVGGPKFVADHGSGFYDLNTVKYGYDRDLLDSAKELPWGSVDEQSYEAWSLGWFGHGAKSFVWDGIYHDGIEAGVSGLWTLVGGNGSDAAGDAWGGLKDVVTGIGLYTATPYDAAMDWAFGPDKESADEVRAKKAAREFGKSLVAWDQWQENPARAAGTTVFNVLTLGVGPLSVVSKTSEVGAVAKSAGVAAKVGEFMDPISLGVRATGKTVSALPKLSDLTSRLLPAARAGATDAHGVHSVIELEDGSKVVIENGEFVVYDKHGAVSGPHPSNTPSAHRDVHVPGAVEREVGSPSGDRELVGAGARSGEAGGHVGDSSSPQFGHSADGTSGGSEGGHGHSGESRGGHTVGHESAGGHDGHPGDDGPDGAGHGHGSGGDHGGADGNPPAPPHGPSPDGEGRPMVRGGETEQQILDAVKGIPGKKRPKPNVLDRVLDRLATEPDGQRVAEIIGSGKFNQSDEYGQVVSSLGANRAQMFQPSADQLIFADDLAKSGVPPHTIDFEQKYPPGADMDIRIADDSGDVYAYQMKHLNDPQNPVGEMTRGKYLLQLAKAEADHHVLLVDGGRGTRADWMANGSYDALMDIHRGGRGPKGEGITFVVRLEDGNLVIPPGSKLDPKDML